MIPSSLIDDTCFWRNLLTISSGNILIVRLYEEGHLDNNNNIIIYLFTAIGLLPGGSGYFTCKQNMKLVTTRLSREGYMRSM